MSTTRTVRRAVVAEAIALPLLGSSELARRSAQSLDLAATLRTPVLVVAEPGCRPSTIAATLHARTRPRAPLVAIDCGAAEAADLERRLFGLPPRRPVAQDI